MFDDAFADFEGEIQAVEIEITLFELFDNIKRVKVVVEAFAEFTHAQIELLFARMAEGRMADVVRERERFCEIGVLLQSISDGAGYLRDFQGVGKAIAEVIRVARGEDLRFGFE